MKSEQFFHDFPFTEAVVGVIYCYMLNILMFLMLGISQRPVISPQPLVTAHYDAADAVIFSSHYYIQDIKLVNATSDYDIFVEFDGLRQNAYVLLRTEATPLSFKVFLGEIAPREVEIELWNPQVEFRLPPQRIKKETEFHWID